MTLAELLSVLGPGLSLPADAGGREVTAVVQDSRKAGPGALFVAIRGFRTDGHRFLGQAAAAGSLAVVVEAGVVADNPGAPAIVVPDTRKALAALAVKFYDNPSLRLKLVGITGTKGKTTTSYLVKSIIEAAGRAPVGLIGTIDYRIGDRIIPAPNTTPESLELQALLAEMTEEQVRYCVMEVSSHALELGRTDGCVFEAAAFTNLAQDHLDFHETMEAYFGSKKLLFAGLAAGKTAVVNIDDPRGRAVAEGTAARVITCGMMAPADVRPEGPVTYGIRGLSFTLQTPAGPISIASPLVGRHNVYNVMIAAGLGIALAMPAEAIALGIKRMRAVPGRMETVDEGQHFGVVVDYAHTEGSLQSLLEAVRSMAAGRIITVFGCGGDRDRTKRPKMGRAALEGSDAVIVTSDNPRTEDPLAIIAEIEAGMRENGAAVGDAAGLAARSGGRTPYLVLPDRADAIRTAVDIARDGDVVVLAGKGHEDYQIIGTEKRHFDDREEARTAIRKRQERGGKQVGAEH